MPIPYELEKDVVNEVNKLFKKNEASMVMEKLRNTQLWAEDSGPPARIHLAMVWKSKGDIEIFLKTLYDGLDWRDLLVEMKLADENWKEILYKKNIYADQWIRK
ncbi:hypothetical protein [Leptospira licerasiae]|uniref:hypothetical protein n=1 Tax=Leptospira licerasiae TaxID=447106 RepID=UPI000248B6EF|nr:hypothetical protein [Leptospira licerasiae]EIE01176.1 hypothetical protein LEP1GSC185_3876 [Leptospira licerasiae serovar Varillal str. VAR 010]